MGDGRGDVRELAPLQLQGGRRGLHHAGIEPDPAGDGEESTRLGEHAAGAHPPQVDASGPAVEQQPRCVRRAAGYPKGAGQEIARPHRHDPQRHLAAGHAGGDLDHGAVAAHGNDQVAPSGDG